ncbi:hypothetical protein A7E77_00660 [Sphingomonas sp. NIC1]|nr:hypothetical protein A7E77_00660 [Sphingomonas sp. NIC1]
MIEFVWRTGHGAMKDDVFDQMRQSPLAGAMLGDEAAFVAHQQRDTRLAAPSRKNRKADAVAESADDGGSPIG